MTAIVVARPAGGYQDTKRLYRITVDGRTVGRLRSGGELTVSVPPGAHVLQARMRWTGSAPTTVAVGAEPVYLLVNATGSPLAAVIRLFSRTRYLRLDVL